MNVSQPICVKGFPESFAIKSVIKLNCQFLNIKPHILKESREIPKMTMLSTLPFPFTRLLQFQSQTGLMHLYNGHYQSLKGNLKRTHQGSSQSHINHRALLYWIFQDLKLSSQCGKTPTLKLMQSEIF